MMLLGGRQSEIKQVAVVTRSPKFTRLLSSILADWKFFTVEDLSMARVIFAERGVTLPPHTSDVVWLTPLPLAEGNFLTVPISLTQLYHLLEIHFFPTPRRHIRVAMDLPLDLMVDDVWLAGRLASLSDRGGRIVCAGEIQRGTQLHIEVKLADRHLRIPSEVLYSIPAGDSPGREQPQIGVLFKPANEREFSMLRHFVERTCLECACVREGIPLNDPSLSWIDMQL